MLSYHGKPWLRQQASTIFCIMLISKPCYNSCLTGFNTVIESTFSGCSMGMSGLPDIYTQITMAPGQRDKDEHIR